MIAVGTTALHVQRILLGKPRIIGRVVIGQETAQQWVGSNGLRWWKELHRKRVGSVNEYVMTEDEFLAAGGVL